MKWLFSLLAFATFQIVSAVPVEHTLAKRTSYIDVANLGYATLNGGTTGGSGGPVTTVSTLSALTSAVSGTSKKIVVISGTISGNTVVRVGSNTSAIGLKGSALVGVGLHVLGESNVIIRTVKISKVLSDAGDAIGIQEASKVWVDHADLSSDRDHDKGDQLAETSCTINRTCEYNLNPLVLVVIWTLIINFGYGGLLDITHGCPEVTVTYCRLYNHWKGSLVGHSDSNEEEDLKITVTYYAYNYFQNINSRTPSFRFGHGHIFNNVMDGVGDGINTRVGAQLLVENNIFSNTKKPLYATDEGFAVARGNDFGGGENTAPSGTFASPPYNYDLISTGSVRSQVIGQTGQTLSF